MHSVTTCEEWLSDAKLLKYPSYLSIILLLNILDTELLLLLLLFFEKGLHKGRLTGKTKFLKQVVPNQCITRVRIYQKKIFKNRGLSSFSEIANKGAFENFTPQWKIIYVMWNEKTPLGQIQKFLENFLRNLRVILKNLLDMLALNDSSSSNFDSYGLELGSLEKSVQFSIREAQKTKKCII